mmetsp:Transcript_6061/g.37577  ORF Transcript_6061/g.37577 Transcript_6061/m.37577 type:complete len:298 (-) Transcript_6061:713-1606(-)
MSSFPPTRLRGFSTLPGKESGELHAPRTIRAKATARRETPPRRATIEKHCSQSVHQRKTILLRPNQCDKRQQRWTGLLHPCRLLAMRCRQDFFSPRGFESPRRMSSISPRLATFSASVVLYRSSMRDNSADVSLISLLFLGISSTISSSSNRPSSQLLSLLRNRNSLQNRFAAREVNRSLLVTTRKLLVKRRSLTWTLWRSPNRSSFWMDRVDTNATPRSNCTADLIASMELNSSTMFSLSVLMRLNSSVRFCTVAMVEHSKGATKSRSYSSLFSMVRFFLANGWEVDTMSANSSSA